MEKSKMVFLFLFMGTTLYAQNLYVGSNSSGVLTNFPSGTNSYSNTYVGYGSTASSNGLSVNGTNTLLTNQLGVYIGEGGSANSMTISNGATLSGMFGRIGDSTSSNNHVLVTGPHSLWSNSNINGVSSNSYVYVGSSGFNNSMTISGGGAVVDQYGAIGWDAISSKSERLDQAS